MVSRKSRDAADRLATDPLETALEAISDALVALQLIQKADEGRALHGHLAGVIDSLRSALVEVRIAAGEHDGPLGYGFIVGPGELDDP